MNEQSAQERLLIVDDDEVFTDTLGKSLGKRGYMIETAFNLESARKKLLDNLPDCVVLDLRIGAESGLTVIEDLITANPDIRIVVLTGYASVATAVEAIKLGATHYLTKPVTADEIVKVLHQTEGEKDVPISDHPISTKRLEWEHIQRVLLEQDGNVSAAARAMGMHRRTLQRKLQKKPVRH